MVGLSIIVNLTVLQIFPTYTGSLMVPSDMVVSPQKLTNRFASGLMSLSWISIFFNVSLKIMSTELPVLTKIRDTLQLAIVREMTSGSL